jgi:hypothetical protein
VRYNFHVSARTQQDDMHHRSILTTRMKKQEEEEEEEEGALLRVSTSPSSTELPTFRNFSQIWLQLTTKVKFC